jgi:histidinol-phosphate aminotransferase
LNIDPYVPGKPIEDVQRELGIDDVIKLASNENPLGPSPLAVQAVQEAAAKLNLYPDSNCYYLKQELSAHLGVSPDNLIIGNGIDELLTILGEIYLNPCDEVVFADPSFPAYATVTRLMGAKPVAVPVDGHFSHDLEAMAKAVTDQTKLVFLCNPNNPTGSMLTREQIDAFLEQAPPKVLVVLDEAYAEYAASKDYPDGIDYVREGRNVIVFRTFSKVYGLAGARVGYGAADPKIISLFNRVREPFNVNCLAQIAASAALRDRGHVEATLKNNERGKLFYYQKFEELGLPYVPTETNFIFVDLQGDGKKIFNALLRKGVIIRPGDIYGYPRCARVTIGKPEENARFIDELRRLSLGA